MHHMWAWCSGSTERVRFPGIRVTGGSALPGVGAGN